MKKSKSSTISKLAVEEFRFYRARFGRYTSAVSPLMTDEEAFAGRPKYKKHPRDRVFAKLSKLSN